MEYKTKVKTLPLESIVLLEEVKKYTICIECLIKMDGEGRKLKKMVGIGDEK